MRTVGFVGLGRMGRAMAKNLVAAGFRVRVWNRTPGKAPEGTIECATPREVAGPCEIVVTMLADDAAVKHVTFGSDGIIAGLPKGAIHVSMSTISVALSRRLLQAHRDAAQRFAAAPVFGRPDAAEKKWLWIVFGGTADELKDCEPLFAALGQATFPMGDPPQANLAKLIGNFLIVGTIEALGEATALAEKAGLEPRKLIEMFGSTMFASTIFTGYGARIAATEFEPAGFAMPLGLKDVSLALQAAQDMRVPLPLASLVRDHLIASLAKGRESWDWGGLAAVVREEAGLPPTRR